MSQGSETLDMTSNGLGEMFDGDFADTCGEKFLILSREGRAADLPIFPNFRGTWTVAEIFSLRCLIFKKKSAIFDIFQNQ